MANTSTPPSAGSSMAAANVGAPYWSGLRAVQEGADAAETTATTYSLALGQSAYGSIANSTDEDWYAIQLVAGQSYAFRLLGFGSSFLTDPLLTLRNATGTTIGTNDDGFTSGSNTHERDAALIFTATTSGTYYLQADHFSTGTGDYVISATAYHPEGSVFTVDEIAWQLINNGAAFYSQPEAAAFNVGADNTLTVKLTGLTAAGQALATQALAVWTAYTGIQFQTTVGTAEITFDDAASGAYATPVFSGGAITSATVNIGLDWLSTFGNTLDSYSFETYLHEIGHALGLGHAGNYNGSAAYSIDNHYLNDSVAWSLMSYMQAQNDEFDFGGPADWNTFVDASFRSVYTPMIADLIAMGHLYDRPTNTFTGNTTYGFGANTGVAAIDQAALSGALMAMTVQDSGGIDTLNFANTNANQTITLQAESLSSVLGGRHNLGIARGVVIENAYGGAGQDDIYGNTLGNVLRGNAGADRLYGRAGNDNLIGGTGNDRLDGGLGTDRATFTGTVATTVNLSVATAQNTGHGLDTLLGIEHLTTGSGNDQLTGNALGNHLVAGAGNDTLNGGLGNDTLLGGDGNDLLTGTAGNDLLNGGAGNDRFVFQDNWGKDVITGFELALAGERIDLSALTAIVHFADLSTNHLSTVAGNAVIAVGANTITLTGINAASLTAGDFLF